MAFTFGFYSDPALTTRVQAPLVFVQANVTPAPAVRSIWFGSPDASVTCQAETNSGVAAITVSPVDAASGSGSPVGDVKLALTAGGLATAVGGAALALPAPIQGGRAHAVEIFVQVTDSTHAAGVKLDLSLTTNPLKQS